MLLLNFERTFSLNRKNRKIFEIDGIGIIRARLARKRYIKWGFYKVFKPRDIGKDSKHLKLELNIIRFIFTSREWIGDEQWRN